MTDTIKRRRALEIVEPSYQPSKADMEEEFTVPEMTLEEAARRLLSPVEVIRFHCEVMEFQWPIIRFKLGRGDWIINLSSPRFVMAEPHD